MRFGPLQKMERRAVSFAVGRNRRLRDFSTGASGFVSRWSIGARKDVWVHDGVIFRGGIFRPFILQRIRRIRAVMNCNWTAAHGRFRR